MIFKDYYKILGLETNRVSITEIKSAYREQAKKYHPDVNVGNRSSEERFKDINEAYRILSESTSKRKYDRIWNRNVTTKRTSYSYSTKNDFFTMFFGKAPEELEDKRVNKVPCKGDNIEIEINLTVQEAFRGITKSISLKNPNGNIKTFKVNIPSGIRNNEKIRIAGQGKLGKNGGNNGDLFIKVKILNNDEFCLKGYDIKKFLKLLPWEATLGTKAIINGIDEDISVYIPAGTSTGSIITIEGKGYKDQNGSRGDLILETQIIIPQNCTDKEKELYNELKNISKYNPRAKV